MGLSVSTLLFASTARYGFSLSKDHDRNISAFHLSQSMKGKIQSETVGMNCNGIIRYSMNLTDELLTFTRYNDVHNGKANCIGYAQVGASICNYAMQGNGYKYKAKPVVGYVHLFGINLCKVGNIIAPKKYKNFIKDHDFVEIKIEDNTIYFDPSLYDYFIDCTTCKKSF